MARPSGKGVSQLSIKHALVDKANSTLVIAAAFTAAIVVFSIFASLELVDKISYQNQVIGYREEARDTLKDNIDSVSLLESQYSAWENSQESIIGTPDKNSKIVLDSLPSKYDFPALLSSIEFVVASSGLTVETLEGVDDQADAVESQILPEVVEMPFTVVAKGGYAQTQDLIQNLSKSIRPFKIDSINIEAEEAEDELTVTIVGESYYQPAKEIGITNQTVRSDKPFKLNESSSNNNNADKESR